MQKVAYATFLSNFTKKLDQVKHLDLNYNYRPGGMNEEFANGYYAG
jgi:hypothetical protein